MNTPLTTARLALTGARAIRSGLVALGIVILVLCAALVAWPRATNGVLTADLHYRVAAASASTRDLESSIDSAPGVDGFVKGEPIDPVWASMPSALTRIRAQMPASVRAITAPGRYVGQYGGTGGQGIPASGPPHPPSGASYQIGLEADPQLKTDAVLVAGRWPGAAKDFDGTTPLEIVIAAKAATVLRWSIGQVQTLAIPDQQSIPVRLVGTVKPRDDTSDYWQLDRAREQAGSQPSVDGDKTVYSGLAWFDAGSWESVAGAFPGQTVVSWFPVSGDGLTVENVSSTTGDLQRFLSVSRRVGAARDNVQARYSTNVTAVTDDFLEHASPASAVLSVVGTGPLGTGCAVVLLGVILLIDRRRSVLALLRGRGASEKQVRVNVAAEMALASVPGAILGGIIAAALTPGGIDLLLVTTILGCALLPVGAAILRGELTRARPVSARGSAASPVRWVTEVVVLLLAALSVVLLLQRGITPDSPSVGIDPLLIAAPVLIVAVISLALLRGYPLVMSWVGSVLRRGRGVVGYVGWASVARKPARFLSIFAVVAGVSITIFSFTILSTERTGIGNAELQRVGSDISVSASPLPADAARRLSEIPGVVRVVPIDAAGGVSLTGNGQDASLFTVDAKQFAAVQDALPRSLRQFAQLGERSDGHSTVIVSGFYHKPAAETSIDGPPKIPVHVVTLDGESPAFVSDPPWILMDRAAVPKGPAFSELPLAALIQLRPGAETSATLAAVRRISGPRAIIVDTAGLVLASKTAPVVSGFELLTALALGFSALMCAIALILTLLLGTTARVRLLARLRALGFGAAQSSGLVAWELGPLAVLGVIAGLLVGLGLPPLLLGAIDLAGFTGSVANPAISIDPLALVGTVLVFLAAAAVATFVAIRGARRARIATVLRVTGED